MKNIFRISLAAIFVMTTPFSPIQAQGKKTEQKIKIITNDGTGKKVVVDTVFTGNSPDSLNLKDGSTVYINHGIEDGDMIHSDGSQHIFVTSSAGGKDGNKTSEITIIQSDSLSAGEGDSDKTRYVIAKDGMVVTIEGNDEAKTKALAEEIEKKLGIESEVGE